MLRKHFTEARGEVSEATWGATEHPHPCPGERVPYHTLTMGLRKGSVPFVLFSIFQCVL